MPEDKITSEDAAKTEQENLLAWQKPLLPMMKGMLIGLALFFFIPSLVQMSYLHWSIFEGTKIEVAVPDSPSASSSEYEQAPLAVSQLQSVVALESYIVERRYHQANVGLMTGMWIRYQGFATGMILALIGASFVLGKMREPSSKIEGESSFLRMSLVSSSPGIVMVVLGVMLMIMTITDQDTIRVRDVPVYLDGNTSAFIEEAIPEPVPTIGIPTASE